MKFNHEIEIVKRYVTSKARSWVLFAFLFTVPISFKMNFPDGRVFQEVYFQSAAMVIGSLFFGNIWITLFFVYSFAQHFFYGGITGYSQCMNIFLTGILFACSRSFFKTHDFKPFALALYVTFLVSACFMVAQAFHVDPLSTPVNMQTLEPLKYQSNGLIGGLFQLPAFSAIFITLVASLFIFLNSWIGIFLVLPLIDSRCSAAFLAWSFLIPFFIYWRRIKVPVPIFFRFKERKWSIPFTKWKKVLFFWPFLLISLIGFILYTSYDFKSDKDTYNSRFENWHLMLRMSLANTLGWGPDSFRNENKAKNFFFSGDRDFRPMLQTINHHEKTTTFRYHSADESKWPERFKGKIPDVERLLLWDTAHNEFLQVFFEGGVFCVFLLFFFLKDIYVRFRESEKTNEVLALFACLCVYLLTSTTQFPFHLARLSGIFGVILGAYYAKTEQTKTMETA